MVYFCDAWFNSLRQMIWEQSLQVIAMLTSIVESDKPKCDQYWPTQQGHPMCVLDFTITCVNVEHRSSRIVLSTLELEENATKKRRTVYHLHYTGWPDHGVPKSPAEFLDVVSCLAALHTKAPAAGPTLVHCSAGIGRTGVLVVITVVLDIVSILCAT